MASNHIRWIRNIYDAPRPYAKLLLCQAGATQAIKKGEICELNAGNMVPLGADKAMVGTIAVADEEIKAGDRAGYYQFLIPRDGDVFEFDLGTAVATVIGDALYWVSSETVTTTAGANVIGYTEGQEHYPLAQGHLSDDGSGDSGTAVRLTSTVRMTFKKSVSLEAAFIK